MWCHEPPRRSRVRIAARHERGPERAGSRQKRQEAILATALVVLLVAGCSKVVDGRAIIAVPPPGTPVQWGPCESTNPMVPDSARRRMRQALGARGLQQARRRRRAARDDPVQGHRREDRLAGDQPGRPRRIRRRVGRQPRRDAAGVRARTLRRGRVRPARGRVVDARGVVQLRRRQRPAAGRPTGRLLTRGRRAHRERDRGRSCSAASTRSGKEFLANVGTVNVVKDLDAIRVAVGDEKLTYLGYSYGTRIGGAYAEEFPQNVRAMVLDGAIDPNADPIEADLRQAAAFQQAFDNYAADCAKDPNCPLGTDPTKAVDDYKSMVEPLVEKPAKTADPRGLAYSDALVGTILPLYSPSIWRNLTDGPERAQGGPRRHVAEAVRRVHGPGPRRALRQRDRCARRGQLRRPARDHRPRQGRRRGPPGPRGGAVHELRRVHRPRADGHLCVLAGAADQRSRTRFPSRACRRSWWSPRRTTRPRRIEAGVDLAKQLGGTLVTFDGTQHTVVFQGNKCIDDIAATYLIDVTVPPPDTRC